MPESELANTDAPPMSCMYLPLGDYGLLVPSAGVAEIVELSPIRKTDNMPDWITGYMSWRGVDIPLVAMERALEKPLPPAGVRGRIAVMHTVGNALRPGFYGIVIQRLPTVVLANERMLTSSPDAGEVDWIDGVMELEVGRGLVPAFDYLEQRLAA